MRSPPSAASSLSTGSTRNLNSRAARSALLGLTAMGTKEPDGTGSIAICLFVFLSVAGLGALSGYWLMQPRVITNPGLAAYKPPPATRLVPLPRKMDAPELAELPAAPADGAEAKPHSPQPIIGPSTISKTAVANPKPVARRSRPKSQHGDDAASAYAYSDHWGYNDRRSYADRSDRGWSSWRGGWNER
jgi:hypothetical protein